jgi:DMSO reductase anchor subunit
MLVLTQLAAGMFAFLPFLVSLLSPQALLALASCAFLALHAGLAASVLHLGRPLGAWRFFLGLRTSWMSREILVFGAFSGCATLTLAAAIGALEPALKFPFPAVFKTLGPHLLLFSSASALLGVLSVGASAMIYIDTRRPAWSAGPTSVRFFGTLLLLGAATTATVLSGLAAAGIALIAVAMVVRLGLWTWETQRNARLLRDPGHPAHGTARLQRKYYPWAPRLRLLLVLGATTLALASLPAAPKLAAALQALSLLFTLCAQLLDRTLFFTTAAAPRMPGRP